jgi:hypothetical protein
MIDRAELIREVADHLFYQQIVGPTPTKFERLKDAVDLATEVGETITPEQAAVYSNMSRSDGKVGPRPSVTMDWVVVEHLNYLRTQGIEPNRRSDEDDGCEILAEAMRIASLELTEWDKKSDHTRLPLTDEAVRKIWDRA